MSDYILFADGRPVAPICCDQVEELEPLFCLRGILLVPNLIWRDRFARVEQRPAADDHSLQLELF